MWQTDAYLRRFLSAVPQLTSSMLRRLVDTVDNVDHVALNAQVLDPTVSRAQMHGALVGTPIGLARIIRNPHLPTVAEAAVTVLDEWQHLGVGGLLIWSLAQAALRPGITQHSPPTSWPPTRRRWRFCSMPALSPGPPSTRKSFTSKLR